MRRHTREGLGCDVIHGRAWDATSYMGGPGMRCHTREGLGCDVIHVIISYLSLVSGFSSRPEFCSLHCTAMMSSFQKIVCSVSLSLSLSLSLVNS